MIFALFTSLFVCHFLGDYCLTTPRMIHAKASGKKLQHIILHSAVHATLMSVVFCLFGVAPGLVLLLFSIELVSHFIIDYAKGLLGRSFPVCADNRQKPFWVLYGFDQLLHTLVIIAMAYIATQ